MPTSDLPQVGQLKLGLTGLRLPHRLLVNNSRPLLGLIGGLVTGDKRKQPAEDPTPDWLHSSLPSCG